MARFIIRGGNPLSGSHRPPGNKNAALPMLAACVLTSEPVTLKHLPLIDDVHTMLAILSELGADIHLSGREVTVTCKGIRRRRLDGALCRSVRSSILFAGPLAARYGRASLSPPGGDVIGRRRLDTHFEALKALGISVEQRHDRYVFTRHRLSGAHILLDEASVTATENLLMAAVLAEGTTTIFNAAGEPHVVDLCRMLNAMGARISGAGTNYLVVEGVPSLTGGCFEIGPDHVDVASYVVAAALTGGSLTIEGAPMSHADVYLRPFSRLGVKWHAEDGGLVIPAVPKLRIHNDYGSAIPKLEDGPWPNFPSDLMSVAIVLATQASGTMLFFEKMFESRMYFVDRLIEMGARIVQCDPHRVIVTGPARLRGIHMSSPDIRAGMSLLLAALAARGESIVENAQSIDRGYESVDRELRRLGADITRVE